MPTRNVGLRDEATLNLLREAARLGTEDIEAGRSRSFRSSKALTRHLTSLAEKAISANTSENTST